MTVPEYTTGGWAAAVRPGFLALLGQDVDDRDVREVWDGADAGVVGALAVLARDGLTGLPPFALVAVAGRRVHVALRGDVEVVLGGDDGEQVLRAGEVSTWSERIVEDVVHVELRTGTPGAAAGTLPVADGIVRAGSLRLALTAPDEAGSVDEVAVERVPAADVPAADVPVGDVTVADVPVAEPEPEPELVSEPASVHQAWADEVVAAAESFLGAPRHAVRETDDLVASPTSVPSADLGSSSQDDHDGLTILSGDLVAIRDQLPSWASDQVPGPFHLAAPVPVVAPARIVLSTGLVVDLDRAVLLGRAPQVARVSNRELPHLVTVPSPQQDISRTHAEVRLEGEDVLVTDLDSTNGVHVSRAGEGARRLHPGEASVVGAGEVVDLGDGVTFTVERGS